MRDLGIMRMGACRFHVIMGLGGFHLCKGFKTDSQGKQSRQGIARLPEPSAVASPLQKTFSRMRRRKTMEEFCESGCHLRFSHQS